VVEISVTAPIGGRQEFAKQRAKKGRPDRDALSFNLPSEI